MLLECTSHHGALRDFLYNIHVVANRCVFPGKIASDCFLNTHSVLSPVLAGVGEYAFDDGDLDRQVSHGQKLPTRGSSGSTAAASAVNRRDHLDIGCSALRVAIFRKKFLEENCLVRQNHFYAFYTGLCCVREPFGSPRETHGALFNSQSPPRRTSLADAAPETTNSRHNSRRYSESDGSSGIFFDCFLSIY